MWGKQYKDVFGKIAGSPDHRDVAEAWVNHWKETQGYITKRDQEYAAYRQRFDPIYERIRPYEQYWQMQGMTAEAGVTQLLSYAEALARDPASMIPQLAQMYGVDLNQLVQQQPYVDPEVQTLKQQLQQMQQAQQQSVQQQQYQVQHRLTEEIRAFADSVDEQGNPKAPHFQRVFDKMVGLARGGLAKDIQSAYDLAVSLDADLQAEIAVEKEKAAAAARAAEAKKAVEASRTVKGKSTEGQPPEKSIRDELEAQLSAAGFN